MEQLIEENLLPFPLDLSPYDFVATNCHTADEEASDEKEKEIKPEPLFRSILKLVIDGSDRLLRRPGLHRHGRGHHNQHPQPRRSLL